MLKRQFVSIFHSLKSKGKRYYWVPPNSEEYNKISLSKQKNDNSQDIFINLKKLIDIQESKIKELNNQLTNQQKVIEKIYYKLQDMENYAYDSRLIQILTLFNGFIIIISKH